MNHRGVHFGQNNYSLVNIETMVTPYHMQVTNGCHPPRIALEIVVGSPIAVTFLLSLTPNHLIVVQLLREVLQYVYFITVGLLFSGPGGIDMNGRLLIFCKDFSMF